MENQISSPFAACAEKKGRVFIEKEYVTYKVVQKVAKGFDPKRPEEFLLEDEVVVDERIPIEEEINSHRNQVGLKNLLKGIVSNKQMNDLISKTQSDGKFIDLTKFPDSHLAIEDLAGRIDKIWAKIPSELKGSLTKEEFLKTMNTKKLEKYVMDYVAAAEAATSKKEGD